VLAGAGELAVSVEADRVGAEVVRVGTLLKAVAARISSNRVNRAGFSGTL
jgi:hypothetical protein